MNKMMIVVFADEAGAQAGLQALRQLHTAGDITLYASGVIVRDAQGAVSVKKSMSHGPVGAATGLAVGGLIGLLGGPLGVAVGALTGTLVGAVRDFWAVGVGLDFVEEARLHLAPGKAALVVELEEEWIVPADAALEALGGQVFRRARSAVAESAYRHDIAAFQAEIDALETELSSAGAAGQARLSARLASARASLDAAVQRARDRAEVLKLEADAKAESLRLQLGQARADTRGRIDDRIQRVQGGYHARTAKLQHAWGLAKEALTP